MSKRYVEVMCTTNVSAQQELGQNTRADLLMSMTWTSMQQANTRARHSRATLHATHVKLENTCGVDAN
eukprot:m.18963 g.18963  ORF g.18963 m.18963 type:complete len:68 (-) comp11662_c0_seq1:219-422(-)